MKIGLWTGETPEAMTFYMAILKTGATPDRFPRRAGIAEKRPLK